MAIIELDARVYVSTEHIVSVRDFPDDKFFRVYTTKGSEFYDVPHELWEFKAFIREWRNNE